MTQNYIRENEKFDKAMKGNAIFVVNLAAKTDFYTFGQLLNQQ